MGSSGGRVSAIRLRALHDQQNGAVGRGEVHRLAQDGRTIRRAARVFRLPRAGAGSGEKTRERRAIMISFLIGFGVWALAMLVIVAIVYGGGR